VAAPGLDCGSSGHPPASIADNARPVPTSSVVVTPTRSGNLVVPVGGDFLKINHPYKKMLNASEAAAWFREQQFRDTYFLIKGSRSMQMEKVLQ